MRLSALLCLIGLVPFAAWAESPGVSMYERGSYAQARRMLEGELSSPRLTEKERAIARLYLAASLHALGAQDQAWNQLEELARRYPEQKVDPAVFPPDFVRLAAEARKYVEAELEASRAARDTVNGERGVSDVTREAEPAEGEVRGGARLLPEVFGFFDPTGKAGGVGGALTYGGDTFEVGARVLLGDSVGLGVQAGLVLGDGGFRPHVALRGTAIPGISAYGGGPVVGARFALGSSVSVLADVGAEFFSVNVADANYRSFALTGSVGLGFDLLSP